MVRLVKQCFRNSVNLRLKAIRMNNSQAKRGFSFQIEMGTANSPNMLRADRGCPNDELRHLFLGWMGGRGHDPVQPQVDGLGAIVVVPVVAEGDQGARA